MAEYIVTVTDSANWQELHNELTVDTSGDSTVSSYVPTRAVTVLNLRNTNTRNTHYDLTSAEANGLKNDSRVLDVQPAGIGTVLKDTVYDGNFNKTSSDTGQQDNWGLLRHTSATNQFGDSLNDPGGNYNYVLDGTGVDVVIQDSGIQADHPEFTDAQGNSRIKQIDWFAKSGVSGTMPDNHYTDRDGHGTHVASTVAGKTFGWARNAHIYVQTIFENSGRELTIAEAFDTLIGWHNKKNDPSDPEYTGRPTVVNMSWGYSIYLDNNFFPNRIIDGDGNHLATLTGGNYRGVSHSDDERDDLLAKGVVGRQVASRVYALPYIVTSVDADIATAASAGIIMCKSAGNDSQKQDVSGGIDFDNDITFDYQPASGFTGSDSGYYHRGGSPRFDTNAGLRVGAIGTAVNVPSLDQKALFSSTGPAVDVYAAGQNIIGAMSNSFDSANYSRDAYYHDTDFFQSKLQGTSMASPQVAGVCALLLQLHPDWTPAQVESWIVSKATNNIFSNGNIDDYQTTNSLQGGKKKVLYLPINGSKSFQFSVV